ncbi:MAG: hypothetical protein OHK0036_06160 [Bacteroidia bacterium]
MRKLIIIGGIGVLLSSCSARLGMFTTVSTKNVNLAFKKSEGKKVKGKCIKFLGMGATIEDAVDNALEQGGVDADILVDAVIRAVYYPFFRGFTAEGIAISSSVKKSELGSEEAYKKWCVEHNVIQIEK